MPRRSASLIPILAPRAPGIPAYRWLYDSLRAEILAGRLRPGRRLPGTRDLARQYGLSRGTVVSAFEQLAAEGYVEGVVGSGTHVASDLPDDLFEIAGAARAPSIARRRAARRLSAYARRAEPFPALEPRPPRAFRANRPALDLFPTTLWSQLAARRLRRISAGRLLGGDPLGMPALRDAIAEYLTASRGVRCDPAQVVVVAGVQEALDLVARVTLDPGDRVCLEDPGYPAAANVFASVGARLVDVSVDAEGMEVSPSRLRGSRLVYVTPAHQFPLGITMSLRRRLALLEWVRGSTALIFEDDYDSEYRYAGRPVPALQGLDASGSVLFAGSFGKVLFPALRLGYLVLPPDLVDVVAAAKSLTSRHPPVLEQEVLLDFIVGGHFGRHLRRMRELYAERLAALLEAAREKLAGALELSPVEAGLQTAGRLRDGLAAETVARAAAARGVEATPLGWFSRGRPPFEGLQLGFAAVDVAEIRRGVRELASAIEEVARAPRRASRSRPAS